jgi:hypothetical protein
MGLMQHIRQSVATITTDQNGFGVVLTLEAPNGQIAEVAGLHSKHHLGVDGDGNRVNSKNAHISFSESALLLINPLYPVRDPKGNVNLTKHKVIAEDSTGLNCKYVIQQWFPNESTGLIVCTLSDFKE